VNDTHTNLFSNRKILLESSKELRFLTMGLETTMTKLASSINPFKTNSLSSSSRRLFQQCLPQSHDTLLDTRTTSLDHDVIVGDVSVTDESTKRRDTLLGGIEFSGTVRVGFLAETDTEDFLVDRGTVHVTVVTGTRDSPHDVGGMPSTNTRNFTKTLVCLAR
jgi:hypothetical protein